MTLSSFILKIKLCFPYENDENITIGGYPVAQVRDGCTLATEEAVMKEKSKHNKEICRR